MLYAKEKGLSYIELSSKNNTQEDFLKMLFNNMCIEIVKERLSIFVTDKDGQISLTNKRRKRNKCC